MTKSNRYFCVVSIKSGTKEINLVRKLKSNNCIGRYKGSSPVIAAKKVASSDGHFCTALERWVY